MNATAVIAWKEFRDDFRSRWTVALTVLFALLALAIAWFGGAASGKGDGEDAELEQIRLAAERVKNSVVFLFREAMFGNDVGRDARRFEDVHPRAISRGAERRLGQCQILDSSAARQAGRRD